MNTWEDLAGFILEYCPGQAGAMVEVFDLLRDRENSPLSDNQIAVMDEFCNMRTKFWLDKIKETGRYDISSEFDRAYTFVGRRFDPLTGEE